MNDAVVEKVARALVGQHIVGMDYAREVAAQCIKAYEEAQWQPIDENTPGDGIDLYGTRNGEKRRFTNAKWSEITFGGRGLDTFRWCHDQWDMYGEFEYTHWQPLPNPPQEPEE